MTRMKEKVILFLALFSLFIFLVPAWAFNLSINPIKESYQSGESVTVSADVYKDADGFAWTMTSEDNTSPLAGDRNSISFNLPENNTGAKMTTVVQGVYGSDSGSIEIPVEPAAAEEEAGPLQVAELYPANGATVAPDTQIYIKFNKPVEVNPDFATKQYCNIRYLENNSSDYDYGTLIRYNPNYRTENTLTIDPDDPCKVWIAIGPTKNNRLDVNTYYDIYFWFNKLRAKDTGEMITTPNIGTAGSGPFWRFNTKTDQVIPASIEITDYPNRLNVGQAYPLKAVVKDKKGNVLDWPVEWEAVSIFNGQATVEAAGNLTGTVPGILRLIARAKDYPDVSCDSQARYYVEIRQNFDRHLLGLWSTELNDREHASMAAPLVGKDGSIYLATGSGSYTLRAYDNNGNKKSDFQEITNIGNPVLAAIDGREYFIAPQGKKMCAFEPENGRLVWQSKELEYNIATRAHVDAQGNIYAGCYDDGKVYAFNLSSDRYLWSYYTQIGNEEEIGSLITVANNRVYVVGKNKVYCLNNQGELQWQYATPTTQGNILVGVEPDSAGSVYFIEDASYYEGEDLVWEYNIYSLNGEGQKRWMINKKGGYAGNLFVDQDDSLYVTINDQLNATQKLTRLSREDGSVDKEFAVTGCDRFLRPGDGYIYTNKYIFNDNLEVVGYTDLQPAGYADDYYRDLSYMQYSQLALCPDGALVRTVVSSGKAAALEKVSLVDTSQSVPVSIEVTEGEITLYQGGTRDIFAQVKDSQGRIIPYLALDYAVQDSTVAAVYDTGQVSAIGVGDTSIDIKVRGHEEVSASVTLHVLSPAEISRMYFINRPADPKEAKLDEEITSVAGVAGEEQNVQVVVVDQHGALIPDLPIKWSLSDSMVVQMYNYAGILMGTSKNEAVLNGLKEGMATLKAELDGYPGFQAQLQVEVKPAPYELLWTRPIDGNWDNKIAYHTQGEDGTLFMVNNNKLKAVSSAGALLWEQDITDQYGFRPSPPLIDDSNVYVYDSSKTDRSLVALSRQDGSLQWSFTCQGAVAQVKAGSGSVYLLTEGGSLYRLSKDSGQALWESPLNLGSANCTLGLSQDGVLYYTRDNQLFRAGEDSEVGTLYTAPEGSSLVLQDIAAAGSIIVEKEDNSSYSIVSVNQAGTANWEVPVQAAVTLSSANGVVYAVTKEEVNPRVYFIREDGSLQADKVLTAPKTAPRVTDPYDHSRPLIGSDGIVYIPMNRLYAVNAADGSLLWTGEFKDGFFKRIARTATLDRNNILYLACDDAGFLALKSKVAGVADESGFYIDTSGTGSLANNSYRNISFRVRNDNAEEKQVRMVVSLEEADTAKVLNYSAAADVLAAADNKSYDFGVHIPRTGNYRVRIALLDQEQQVITEKILPVS